MEWEKYIDIYTQRLDLSTEFLVIMQEANELIAGILIESEIYTRFAIKMFPY